jgi:hypothetical protein
LSTPAVAETWAEFLQEVRDARHSLGDPPIVWFRGQAKSEYALMPSLLRYSDGVAKERALFDEYERSAAYIQGERKNEWDMLNDMQHYGIPTRLLDWTDVLGIAIAFALYDSQDDARDSAIYVLDPLALNELSGRREIHRPVNSPEFSYKTIYWEGRPFSPKYPMAIDGTLHNPRLRAQNGVFTIHGRDPAPLEVQAAAVVRKLTLPSRVKPEAREFLEHANLNPFSIYPDIVGMARHIGRKHLGA